MVQREVVKRRGGVQAAADVDTLVRVLRNSPGPLALDAIHNGVHSLVTGKKFVAGLTRAFWILNDFTPEKPANFVDSIHAGPVGVGRESAPKQRNDRRQVLRNG